MILQTSFSAQVETIVTLAGVADFAAAKGYRSLKALRRGYRRFLASLQQRHIELSEDTFAWLSSVEEISAIRRCFANDSLLNDKEQAKVMNDRRDPSRDQKQDRLTAALRELALYSPIHAEVFNTIITDIFVLPSDIARAGSTSQAIGAIWANPKLTYTTADFIEMLIHEFTHHAMFLDELRYGHYHYPSIFDCSTWARSAILNTQRPLDKVLHSITVSTEVLLFREQHLGHPAAPRVHPPTDIMISQLRDSIASAEESILMHPTALKTRAIELLRNAKTICCNISRGA